MTQRILTCALWLIAMQASAQISRQWVATHNGQGDFNDRYTCMVSDASGHYYLGGSTVNPGSDRDFLVVKMDASGNVLWSLQLDGNGQAADEVLGLALTPQGELVATAISKGDNTSEDFWTVKMSAAGDTLWTRRYDFIGEYDQPNALSVDASGNIFVTGLSDGNPGVGENDDYLTLKYSPNGSFQWAKRFNGLGDAIDRAVALVTNNAGQVFVTGRSDNGTNDDYVTICYNTVGDQQWIKFDDRGDRDRATALTLDPSGNLFIAGQSDNGDNDDFWVLKYTSAGVLLWQKAYDFVDDDRALAIATDATGNVFVTGQSDKNFDATRNWDIATVGFSPNGAPLWVTRYDGPFSQDEFPTAIATDAAGHVFVTGRGDNDPSLTIDNEIITVQYLSTTGVQQWKTVYPGLANRDNASNSLVSDGAGGCVLVGYAEDSTAFRNALAIRYNNQGTALWSGEFNGAGDNNDAARHVGVDDLGNVYAAGYTVSNNDNRNLTLLHFNADGTFECRYVENGSAASAIDDAQGLVLSADGLPIAMGYVKNSGTSNDLFVAKFNTTCDTLWDKNINGGANGTERAYDMTRDGLGNIYLTGRSDQQAGTLANDVCYTLKIQESNGQTLWVKKFEVDTNATRSERGVVVKTKDGNQIYVLGRSFNGADFDLFLVKYDANGNQIWSKNWSAAAANDVPVSMELDAAGNIYLLATSSPAGTDSLSNIVLLKYSPSGLQEWSIYYNYSVTGHDEAVALAVDNNGDIILTGNVDVKTGPEEVYGILVLKHGPNGSVKWQKVFNENGSANYYPDAMALKPNGQIYLVGHGNQGTQDIPNFNVLAYILDSNGNEMWADSYDGTEPNGYDSPNALVLKGQDFYIAGGTEQLGQQRDVLLIKYSGNLVPTEEPTLSSIHVFPNPAFEQITFSGLPANESLSLEWSDVNGRVLSREFIDNASLYQCTLAEMPSGMLFYRIFSENKVLGSGKVFHSN